MEEGRGLAEKQQKMVHPLSCSFSAHACLLEIVLGAQELNMRNLRKQLNEKDKEKFSSISGLLGPLC